MATHFHSRAVVVSILLILVSCQSSAPDTKLALGSLNLRRGEVISCGPTDQKLGTVVFPIQGTEKEQELFNLGMKLLHSFEYDEAEKVFARMLDENDRSPMAYWGVAMANFHPLWTPPTQTELEKGAKAIALAKTHVKGQKRERAFIDATAAFYNEWETVDHRTRSLRFEKAMENLHALYPDDREAVLFYALSLTAAADPSDKTFQKQKKAGQLLNTLYSGQTDHPGLLHYIIHTYDYPELATMALPAARKYASVAPSSAHALHMPSHIFTRLGLWDECIQSNLASVASAQCYAQQAGMEGHWDEELHGLDYLVYAFLQKGDNRMAKNQLDYLKTFERVQPVNFKVTYAFAAVPARYALENRLWEEAAQLSPVMTQLPWKDHPWQKALIHFARLLGAAHTNRIKEAQDEHAVLKNLHDQLLQLKDSYKANQVAIQMKAGEAWIQLKTGKAQEAVALMQEAADMEDKTGKHPVTPGEILPARELLGDMYMELRQYDKALEAYEADLAGHANRFNGLFGAAKAAEKMGDKEKAKTYYKQLLHIANTDGTERSEITTARQFLGSAEG